MTEEDWKRVGPLDLSVSFRTNQQLWERFDEACRKRGVSRAQVLNYTMDRYVRETR